MAATTPGARRWPRPAAPAAAWATSPPASRPREASFPPSGTAESSAWSPKSRWPGSRTHRVNQRRRSDALEQEPGNARGGRPAPVIRRLKGGQHDHLAVRQPPGQLYRSGKAVRAGHADVQQRDVGTILDRGRYDAGAGRHLGDHLDAVLQGE